MDLRGIAVAMGFLYLQAEEEAAQLRRIIVERRARMRRGMLRRRAILSCLSHDQSSSQLYTQLNITVPFLALFFS
ncbi:unnamed protein product [Gadus morhua 'NCC']